MLAENEIGNPCEDNAARIMLTNAMLLDAATLPFNKDRAATEELREDVSNCVSHETH